MFLHYLMDEEHSSLVSPVLQAQATNPSKKDYFVKVKEDLVDLKIHLSFDEIKAVSPETLRNYFKKQIIEKALGKGKLWTGSSHIYGSASKVSGNKNRDQLTQPGLRMF